MAGDRTAGPVLVLASLGRFAVIVARFSRLLGGSFSAGLSNATADVKAKGHRDSTAYSVGGC
jgi:hypothetical protein